MNIFDTTILEKYLRVIREAAHECECADNEEKGGVILYKDSDFKFIKLENKHKGTSTSYALYEVNPKEFGMIMTEYVTEGWQLFSSFHTHPSFPPTPSSTDMTYLFPGYKYNTIYSKLNKVFNITVWIEDKVVGFHTLNYV
jgi:proteasome lid subunit RPN8/RPN11